MKFKWFALLGLGALMAFTSSSEAQQPRAALQSYTVVKTYSHDPKAYTQGLVWNGKGFFESTGRYGSSSLRETTLEGKVLRSVPQDDQYFSEGLAWLGGKLYQLTWTSKKAFVYNAETFKLEGTRAYKTEGWGLTTDGRSLILSDGSSTLYWLEPKTFAVRKTVKVTNAGNEISRLNELEWIDAEIWANVWGTDLIARIDPTSGRVKAFVNLVGLRPEAAQDDTDKVLNGIAYDSKNKRLFVTGKLWDKLYEIKVK
jgi:glutaminyl-peptide cyclotransferase